VPSGDGLLVFPSRMALNLSLPEWTLSLRAQKAARFPGWRASRSSGAEIHESLDGVGFGRFAGKIRASMVWLMVGGNYLGAKYALEPDTVTRPKKI
jgi:hypothetical protein